MYPTILKIGSLALSSYGLMLATSILVGIFLAKRFAREEGVDEKDLESMAFWVVIMGILGTRFLYTFVEHWDYYSRHPIEFFYFREGGLSFIGGPIFGVLAGIIYCRKKKLRFWQMADIMAPSMCLGLAISKIGCFLAGCCHGKVCDLAWGISFTHPESLANPKGVPLHPTQLYESISWLLLFFVLLKFRSVRKNFGEVLLLFSIVFGVVRFFLEYFRGNPGTLGPLTTAQMLNIPIVAMAIMFWILNRKKGWSDQLPD